ncbi:MAG: hypothetical protein AAFZ65_05195, partial [Planctomycetota bacterium]
HVSPRILEFEECPHCGVALPEETPRTCPECGGSLQQRYLQAGCLSSKPMLLLLGAGLLARVLWLMVEAA